jgi:hypothetical protein
MTGANHRPACRDPLHCNCPMPAREIIAYNVCIGLARIVTIDMRACMQAHVMALPLAKGIVELLKSAGQSPTHIERFYDDGSNKIDHC